jgi:hypothetical protein
MNAFSKQAYYDRVPTQKIEIKSVDSNTTTN